MTIEHIFCIIKSEHMFDFYFGVIITELLEKLKILGDSAKYDAACTSSGSDRGGTADGIGNAVSCGICHSFAADGRCISLLKVLMTNYCIFDCKYCINRKSNDVERARFEPRELAELVINFISVLVLHGEMNLRICRGNRNRLSRFRLGLGKILDSGIDFKDRRIQLSHVFLRAELHAGRQS